MKALLYFVVFIAVILFLLKLTAYIFKILLFAIPALLAFIYIKKSLKKFKKPL